MEIGKNQSMAMILTALIVLLLMIMVSLPVSELASGKYPVSSMTPGPRNETPITAEVTFIYGKSS